MENTKIFLDGVVWKEPRDGAPDFVKGGLSINAKRLFDCLQLHKQYISEKGWINIDLKTSKAGTYYFEINTWKPKPKEPTVDNGLNSDGSQEPVF